MIREEYLKEFEYLNDVIYLDTASVGMMPQSTIDVCATFQQDMAKTYARKCFDGTYGKIRSNCVKELAALIGAQPEEIALTQNTTEGASLLVHSLDWTPGDSVVTIDNEYPSVLLGWAKKQEEGLELRTVKNENGTFSVRQVLDLIDERTKLVTISMVHNHTGFFADVREIGRECRKRGVLFAVDAIQALGRIPVNVKEMEIDFLTCGGFKGLLGTFGAGFIYCRKDLIPMLKPLFYGYSNFRHREGFYAGLDVVPVPEFEAGMQKLEGGSVSTYACMALGKSIGLLHSAGIEEIQKKIKGLETLFRNCLNGSWGKYLLGSMDPERQSGVICFKVPDALAGAAEDAFCRNRILALAEEGLIRVSFHFYNTEEQAQKAVAVMNELIKTED